MPIEEFWTWVIKYELDGKKQKREDNIGRLRTSGKKAIPEAPQPNQKSPF